MPVKTQRGRNRSNEFRPFLVRAALESQQMATAVSIILGGVITILTTMVVEHLRRPVLSLAIEEPPLDLPSPDGKGQRRNLRLILRNKSLAKFLQRSAALQCRGEITFHNLDGQSFFKSPMSVRWVSSPEPIANQIIDLQGNVQFSILDFTRGSSESRIDVYPGEKELLDVAIRFDGEPDSYGWNNESYLYNWRNPNRKLPPGRYLVKVVITSSGQKFVGKFRLINNVDKLADFRLTAILPEDRTKPF
jgi:hypothetical protein